jgi:precorrin-3B synthase
MNAPMRRGACPALSAPMQTGDGLLVRLNLSEGGFAPAQLTALCTLAGRHGNGIVEVTARGSFQIRGLTPASAPLLAADVAALQLDLRTGVPVETSPLAGLDPEEVADPLPLVRAIRAATDCVGLSSRLGPKVSVVVDGGGNIDLSEILADVRLTATREDGEVRWLLAIGGDAATARPVAILAESSAATAIVGVLKAIAAHGAAARGRELAPAELDVLLSPFKGRECRQAGEGQRQASNFPPPLIRPFGAPSPRKPGEGSGEALPLADGRFAVSAALPFGSIHTGELHAFLNSIEAAEIRLAPQRSLILICRTEEAACNAAETARAHDLVVDADDPRRRIAACPGAPACASGRIATREIARRLASTGALPGSVHVSGCAKGCAHPAPADFVLVGTDAGIAVIRRGRASDTPFTTVPSADDALALIHGTPV